LDTLRSAVDAGVTLEVGESLGGVLAAPSVRAPAISKSRARPIALGFLAMLLAVLAAATLAACCLAIVVPQQLDEGEPLIYGLAGRALQRVPLYQPVDRQPFVEVHYTPLYYWLVAVLREYGGSGFAPGRAVSLCAGLVTATLVGHLAAFRARSWWAGGFAALMFLALAFPGGPAPFLALERVDVLGVGFSVAAIAVLARRTDRTHLIAAGGLAGLALLTKQSLFAAALAGTIWLAMRNPRKAGLFALVVAATVLVPALRYEFTSAGAFWDNIGPANPSAAALPFGAYLLKELAVIQGMPTLLALLYVIAGRAWKDPHQRLLVIYWLATTLSITGIIKVGANHNYWIEFAALNAVLATLGIWKAFRTERRPIWAVASMLPIWLFAFQLGVLTPARFIMDRAVDVVPLSWTLSASYLVRVAGEAAGFDGLVNEVRGVTGVVLAEGLDVAVLGNQPVQFEPFAFSMLEHEGRWNSQPLVADICAGRISLLVLSYPIESDIHPVGLLEFPMWPASVMTALRHAMQLDKIEAYHWLYRPVVSPGAPAIARCQVAAAAAR
jgi:hypothetical protein